MKKYYIGLRMFLWMTLLTGVIYPLLITLIAQVTMNENANGSLIRIDEKIVGSELIAQKFESVKYFWPRPSANDYNPLQSGGSNLGPTSVLLKKAVEERKAKIAVSNVIENGSQIPSELLFASGSGLDPHISSKAAIFQVDRVAKARGIDKESLLKLIKENSEKKTISILGKPRVNVLKLNLALDKFKNADTK